MGVRGRGGRESVVERERKIRREMEKKTGREGEQHEIGKKIVDQ